MAGSAAAPPGPGPPAAAAAAAGAGLMESDEYESLPSGVALGTHMVAGAVAGIMEHTVMYPVDSVKTRMQSLQPDPGAQYRSVYEALKKMVLTEGFWRPLRGINVTMLGAGPAHALYFACYEKMKKSLSDIFQPGGNSHLANGIAGSVATLLHDAVMNPAEGHPLHHLRAHAGAPEPPPPLQPPVAHRGRRRGRSRGRRRHHAPGRVQDAAQHAGEHGPELPQDQGAPVGHGQRLQHRLPAGRGSRLLQRRPGSRHLPDALHGHRLVRVRVLQVLPHQARAGEKAILVKKEWGSPWASSQPAQLEFWWIHISTSPCPRFPVVLGH
ncbi:mitoferrin-1 isoform X2 [Vidua macroura]|uniref:mitoferrin-1 isoform X2 n=1 Tax=Vidua macroura TaxID=187451 RepID=UPI0023A79420|nr:mitoferrin-1 isoform X2 [Vidua macroura]